jgi:hypothetical protein
MGHDVAWSGRNLMTFQRNVLPPPLRSESKLNHSACLFSLLFDPIDGWSMFLQNVGTLLPNYKHHIPEDVITVSKNISFYIHLSSMAHFQDNYNQTVLLIIHLININYPFSVSNTLLLQKGKWYTRKTIFIIIRLCGHRVDSGEHKPKRKKRG